MYIVLGVVAAGILTLLYFVYAPGPVAARAYARARQRLDAGDWQEALRLLEPFSNHWAPAAWRNKLRHLSGECRQRGMDAALSTGEYEEARSHAVLVATLLEQPEAEQIQRIIDAGMAEIRRRFAAQTEPVVSMIDRIEKVAGQTQPQAQFWRAMCLLRDGDLEMAAMLLTAVSQQVGRDVIDPALYAGLVLHRLGRPTDALKWLSEASRIDGNCPLVPWQIGITLMASQGDSGMAVRVLQRAMGPRGLSAWQREPGKLWIEGMPEGRSYIRQLAEGLGDPRNVTFPCPLLGSDLNILIRQGNLALAQALFKQDRFAESAESYGQLLQTIPPTPVLLRGYGIALARSGQYDAAFKQLRLAFDQEQPHDLLTAGYLALCAAMGKPTNAEDKPRNIAWAIKLLARYPVLENTEWSVIARDVHAEARQHGLPLSLEDQELLCDALASVQATDVKSAASFVHLAKTHPEAIKPVYAWLYVRAATVHGLRSSVDLLLFTTTFKEAGKAQTFYALHNWNLAESEYTYLERTADLAPGRFPEVLGPDYPPKGETLLLDHSRRQEQTGQTKLARVAIEVLLKLSPHSLPAHDRLACLSYREGNIDRAIQLLTRWCELAPSDHWPLVRRAIVEQERGNSLQRSEAISLALSLTLGRLRAAVAYMGATLSLREWFSVTGRTEGRGRIPLSSPSSQQSPTNPGVVTPKNADNLVDQHPKAVAWLDDADRLLRECLRDDPTHINALTCLAAIRSVCRDSTGLAKLAAQMNRPDVADPSFQYLSAMCHYAAGRHDEAVELAVKASADPAIKIKSLFVAVCAHLKRGRTDEAVKMLQTIIHEDTQNSMMVAKAILGQIYCDRLQYDEAIRCWSSVDAGCRTQWGLDEPLRQIVLLSGLLAMDRQRYEQAEERLREAGRLGLRDRRLGGLITLALVKAGQNLLYDKAGV
ncbi:MAG: hypothetical protein EBV06_13055 [Planctomycetia bacterium]|nr:hypothetical protein [Planctomycetia bacterium]